MAFAVNVEHAGRIVIAKLSGRLDGPAAPAADQALMPLVVQGATVLLDLTSLDYVSSAGLRSFLKAGKQAKAVKARLALCGINAEVQEVFDISGFTAIFTIYPDRAEALPALG